MSWNPPPPESDLVAQAEYLRRVRPVAWKSPEPKQVYDLAVLGGAC